MGRPGTFFTSPPQIKYAGAPPKSSYVSAHPLLSLDQIKYDMLQLHFLHPPHWINVLHFSIELFFAPLPIE